MNRLPFGISSAPEIFQRRMSEILKDIDGVICHMDDILIHSSDQTTHNKRVRTVLKRLREAGLTLNEKCEFSKDEIKFIGHIIDGRGIRADPQKVEAIVNFPAPTNITELQRFLGMINQLAKFTPDVTSRTEPL
ncbi:Pol polyprotein [Elysia marginata]|uniref:Pol polyprotein n=1 Tax=Elysia marginata TaxID=1093978 RepID=A0AAV4IA38_9GAST|nr:Pol polyprotein [Elysia marginata]